MSKATKQSRKTKERKERQEAERLAAKPKKQPLCGPVFGNPFVTALQPRVCREDVDIQTIEKIISHW